jgi:hypothetical protein
MHLRRENFIIQHLRTVPLVAVMRCGIWPRRRCRCSGTNSWPGTVSIYSSRTRAGARNESRPQASEQRDNKKDQLLVYLDRTKLYLLL